MSNYASLTDLQTYLGSQTSSTDPGVYQQATDRVAATTANSTVGQEALDYAEALINGYLAKKYPIPIDVTETSLAALMRGLTLQLAAFRLIASLPFISEIPDRLKELRDEAIEYLRDVVSGETTLPAVAPLEAPETDGDIVTVGGNDRVFDEDSLGAI